MKTILFVILLSLFSFSAQAQEDCSVLGINPSPANFPISVSEHGQVLLTTGIAGNVHVWDELNGLVTLNGYPAIGLLFTRVNNRTQVVLAQNASDPFNVPRMLWDSVKGYQVLDLLHTYSINDEELIAGHDINDPDRFVIKNPYTNVEVFSSYDDMFDQDFQGFYHVTKSRHLAQVGGRVVYFWDGVEYTKYTVPGISQLFDMSDTGYVAAGIHWWTRETGTQPVPVRTTSPNAAFAVNNEGKLATGQGVYDLVTEEFVTDGVTFSIANNGQVVEFGTVSGTVNLRSTKLAPKPVMQQVGVVAGGNSVGVAGANIMEGARVYFNTPFPPLFVGPGGTLAWADTSNVPDGTYEARVVNPSGCGSDEVYEVTIDHGIPTCGLIGIEPLALLFLRRKWRA